MRTTLPTSSCDRPMRASPTYVPFLLFRSSITKVLPSWMRTAWEPLTLQLLRTRSLPERLPIRVCRWISGYLEIGFPLRDTISVGTDKHLLGPTFEIPLHRS